MEVVGVDACKAGWFALVLSSASQPTGHVLSSIDELESAVPNAEVIAIDIPIGLPSSGRRQADLAVREALRARRNSVFFTAPRDVLEALTHREATIRCVELTGVGISQ